MKVATSVAHHYDQVHLGPTGRNNDDLTEEATRRCQDRIVADPQVLEPIQLATLHSAEPQLALEIFTLHDVAYKMAFDLHLA